MDLKKHKNPRYATGMAGSDKVRMGAMVVLLVVVGYLFFHTSQSANRVAGPHAGDEFQPTTKVDDPPASKVDPSELLAVQDSTRDERVVVESRPLLHLLFEANKSVAGDFVRLDAKVVDGELFDEVLAHPDEHRGAPLIAKAGVVSIVKESTSTQLEGSVGQELDYWTIFAQDREGRSFTFSMLNEPQGIESGDVIRIEGFFLKKRAFFASQDVGSLTDPTLHLVGKRAVPSFYLMPLPERLDMELLDTVADYEIEDKLHIEEEPLYHVLGFLQKTDAATLAPYAKDVTSHVLRSKPQEWRGRPVRVLGTFYSDTWGRQLGPEGENPLDMPAVQHGLLVHSGPSFTYLISAEKEPDWVEPGEPVIVQGVFLKRYVYQTQGGKAEDCPLIIVNRYEPFEPENTGVVNFPAYAIIGIGVIFLGWFLYSALGDRRATKEYRKRFYAAKRRQLREEMENPEGGAA